MKFHEHRFHNVSGHTRKHVADVPPNDKIQDPIPQHGHTHPAEAKHIVLVESLNNLVPLDADALSFLQGDHVTANSKGTCRGQGLSLKKKSIFCFIGTRKT